MGRGKLIGLGLTAALVASLVIWNAFQGESGGRAPPTVSGITAKLHRRSVLMSEILLTNGSGVDLKNLDLVLAMVKDDGTKPGIPLNWATWENGETKSISIQGDRFQKLIVRGIAFQGASKRTINSEWTWNW